MLAPAAGLLVLPLAVVAVASEGGRQTVVRLEPAGAGGWRVVASSDIAVLPDARPVQADLDAQGSLPVGNTPAQFREFLTEEIGRWKKLVAEANIRVE